jgi:hypothetical protein
MHQRVQYGGRRLVSWPDESGGGYEEVGLKARAPMA